MTRIAATLERTFYVGAPIEELIAFFEDPQRIAELLGSVDRIELVGKQKVRWVLKEKIEKGVRFKGDYTVQYVGNGKDRLGWTCVEGNMGNEGEVKLSTSANGGTEVVYTETVEPDLPITKIMAKLMKPIVQRELREEVGGYLDRVEQRFNS